MIFNSTQIKIVQEDFCDDPCLHFSFSDKLTEATANEATEAWHTFLENQPLESYVFIWDCLDMSGFEMGARKLWYKYMNIHKNQISRVIVISGNLIIRSAAKVMLEFFGLPYRVIRSREELKEIEELLVEY